MRIRVGHISMQSTDSPSQQRSDARRVFARARTRGYAWITGTEANTNLNATIFREEAEKAGLRFTRGGDVWIAVPEARAVASTWADEWTPVVHGRGGSKPGPHFPTRGVLRVSFVDRLLGPVTVLASHLQTKRTSKVRPEDNEAIARTIGNLAIKHGAGIGRVFYGGDQNLTDRVVDTFKGAPLTSCWDELKKWPGTGHDNIDVIGTYDGDEDVTCVSARVFDDTDFPLNTDHYLLEAEYEVATTRRPVPAPKPKPQEKPVKKKFQPPSPPVVGGVPNVHSGTDNKDGGIDRVVIHSAVIQCQPGAARTLGHMNQTSKTGSWHYATDPNETIQCSWDSFVCWHDGVNRHSLAIEMADWPVPWPAVKLTKAVMRKVATKWRWRTTSHSKMLRRTAELTAELCLAYDIPLVFLSVSMLRKGQKGITIHANMTKAFGKSTHWDPGAWPRYRFMRMVKAHAKKLQQS